MSAERFGMKHLVAALLIVAASLTAARAGSDAMGHWEGTMQRGSSVLDVSFDFSPDQAGQSRGLFTAGDLGAMDVPLAKLRLDAAVHWELVGDRTTTVFDGTLSGGAMHGTFSENQRQGTFSLHKMSSSVEKPYTESSVRFTNAGVALGGTVLAPRASGRHPALVLTPGSGDEGRWASRFIADYVARNGVVALIYDKRGVGESTGGWRTSTLTDLAEDARAGIHLLAQRNDVDPQRLGYFGHSQGAYLAPFVAQDNPEVRWIIAADGNVGPQYKQDLFRVDTALAKRYTGTELADATALYSEFVDVARSGSPHERLNADEAKFKNARWFDDLALPDERSWIWPWYKGVGNCDNSAAWKSVLVPVLLIYGEQDEVVPVTASIDGIGALLKSRHNAPAVQVLAGADHTLHTAPAGPDGWPHNAPGFPAIVVNWIREH